MTKVGRPRQKLVDNGLLLLSIIHWIDRVWCSMKNRFPYRLLVDRGPCCGSVLPNGAFLVPRRISSVATDHRTPARTSRSHLPLCVYRSERGEAAERAPRDGVRAVTCASATMLLLRHVPSNRTFIDSGVALRSPLSVGRQDLLRTSS